MTLRNQLIALGACQDAIDWVGNRDLAAAWAECSRGDWMLWLLGMLPTTPRPTLVLAACECARLSLHKVPAGEDRPRLAIEAAEDWARGGLKTLQQVQAASAAAYASAYDADDAVCGAAYAAYAVCGAADAVGGAADAADAAVSGAHQQCADIVRRHFPLPPVLQ